MTEGKHLLAVEYSKLDNQLPITQMEVGEKTRFALSKLSSDKQKVVLRDMKLFYVAATKYLIGHLPIDNKLLRNASFLHPRFRKNEHGTPAIREIEGMMPTVSEEVALVTDEWKVYQAGSVDSTTSRIDHCWANIFQDKTLLNEFKFVVLPKLVKSVLSLVHGNVDVERSLSANKKTATPDRAALGDLTINGLRAVNDLVRVCGEPHRVPITKGFLQASREAHKAYAKRLSDENKDHTKEKVTQDAEAENQKVREKEAHKLKKTRLNLAEKEKI